MQDTIYIETDEEITSIVDRLNKADGDRVALVVPRGAIALQSLVNLKLLKREAVNSKKNISIATQDAIGKKLLALAGIPLLELDQNNKTNQSRVDLAAGDDRIKVHHFQERQIDTNQKDQTEVKPIEPQEIKQEVFRKRSPRSRLAIFLMIVLLIAAVAVVFAPQASIKIAIEGEPFDRELDFEISTKIKVPSLEQSQVPGDFIEDETTQRDTFSANGKKDIGEKAKGSAQLLNDSGIDQILPKASKLTGGGLDFVTTADATIPKAILNAAGDKVAGKATVPVEAAQAGDKANVSNLSVAVSKDKLSGKIESASGGSTNQITVVSTEDIAAAKSNLVKKIQDELKNSLVKKSGKVVLDGAINIEIIETKPSVAEGDQANQFDMSVKAKGKAIAFQEAAFKETFLALLKRNLPLDKDLVLSDGDEIATQVTDSDFTSGRLTVKAAIKTHVAAKVDTRLIAKQLVGKKIVQAPEIISEQVRSEDVRIDIFPSWLARLPLFGARINVVVQHK